MPKHLFFNIISCPRRIFEFYIVIYMLLAIESAFIGGTAPYRTSYLKLFRKECDFMNEKTVDILKYFFLTFASLEIMYYIARSSLNIGLVLLISIVFTALYSLDKYKVLGKLLASNKSLTSDSIKKDKSM